jgi:hypothetical protein
MPASSTTAVQDDSCHRTEQLSGRSGVQCSQPIPTERLDTLPMASLCPPCHRIHQERVTGTAAIESKPARGVDARGSGDDHGR